MQFLIKYLSLVQHSEKVAPYRMNVVAIVDGLNKSPTDLKNSWSYGASFVILTTSNKIKKKQEVRPHFSIPNLAYWSTDFKVETATMPKDATENSIPNFQTMILT